MVDRPARAPLRVVLRLPHNLRVACTILTILTRRDMLRVAMEPITDLDMARITAIIVLMAPDIGVGPEEYLFRVAFRSSNGEGLYPSRCGYSKWNIISPSPGFRNESM